MRQYTSVFPSACPEMIRGVRASSISMESTSSTIAKARPLYALGGMAHHIIAQVIEAEFVVGSIGYISRVCALLVPMFHLGKDDAHADVEKPIDTPHPFGIALREVIVHGNQMNSLAGQRVEISRQGSHQSLAFTCTHLGNLTLMQRHATDELHVEMAHSQNTFACLPHNRERIWQKRINGCPFTRRCLNSPVLARSSSSVSASIDSLEGIDASYVLGILLD